MPIVEVAQGQVVTAGHPPDDQPIGVRPRGIADSGQSRKQPHKALRGPVQPRCRHNHS